MWDIEEIPNDSILYRLAHKVHVSGSIPKESLFIPDADGLSVNWSNYADPIESLVLTGLTYKYGKAIFKDPREYSVFWMTAGEIRELKESIFVSHTPNFNDPEQAGTPNNRSHSSVTGYYGEEPEQVEIRAKLKGIAKKVEGIDYDLVQRNLESRQQIQRGLFR